MWVLDQQGPETISLAELSSDRNMQEIQDMWYTEPILMLHPPMFVLAKTNNKMVVQSKHSTSAADMGKQDELDRPMLVAKWA